jgi:hypothetical protein
MATKLNAQVIIKNLQNMHEKSLPPTGARRRGSSRGGPTQVNGIFDRSMESARYKLGAARAVGHCYAA